MIPDIVNIQLVYGVINDFFDNSAIWSENEGPAPCTDEDLERAFYTRTAGLSDDDIVRMNRIQTQAFVPQ
jgi:hypothetical protein